MLGEAIASEKVAEGEQEGEECISEKGRHRFVTLKPVFPICIEGISQGIKKTG